MLARRRRARRCLDAFEVFRRDTGVSRALPRRQRCPHVSPDDLEAHPVDVPGARCAFDEQEYVE
jgi:hypothetical protein